MLRSYLRLVLFTTALLFGIQAPGLISDYGKRVEAHLIESQQAVKGFRASAQQFFKGDIQALIQHYRSSDDPVFRNDAGTIENLLVRTQQLERQWLALQGSWLSRALHVAMAADPDIRRETLEGYTWQIQLSPVAIGWGIVSAFVLTFVVEGLYLLLGWVVNGGRRKPPVRAEWH